MKKTLIIASLLGAIAGTLVACATPADNTTYALVGKGGPGQMARDYDQCKFETSQRHRAEDPQHVALIVDCMVAEKGYVLVPK